MKLRSFHTSDLDALVRLANNPNIAKTLTDRFPHPYTEQDGLRFLEFAINSKQDDKHLLHAIEVDGQFAGGIGLHPESDIFRLNTEIAYWVGEPYWNKGITTQAIKEVVKYGFTEFDFTRIFARLIGSNKASARVLEKAGFTLECTIPRSIIKNGLLEDCLVYAQYKI